jgi:hypothetical protein
LPPAVICLRPAAWLTTLRRGVPAAGARCGCKSAPSRLATPLAASPSFKHAPPSWGPATCGLLSLAMYMSPESICSTSGEHLWPMGPYWAAASYDRRCCLKCVSGSPPVAHRSPDRARPGLPTVAVDAAQTPPPPAARVACVRRTAPLITVLRVQADGSRPACRPARHAIRHGRLLPTSACVPSGQHLSPLLQWHCHTSASSRLISRPFVESPLTRSISIGVQTTLFLLLCT